MEEERQKEKEWVVSQIYVAGKIPSKLTKKQWNGLAKWNSLDCSFLYAPSAVFEDFDQKRALERLNEWESLSKEEQREFMTR